MKTLWAVIIGRKKINTRYIAYEPFSDGDNKNGRLAIYECKKRAEEAKEKILNHCGHKDIFVICLPVSL